MGKGAAVALLFMLMLVFSCDQNRVFDKYHSLPNVWHKDSVVQFEVRAPDTMNRYNLFINLRNNSKYEYRNLFLITEVGFPHGKVLKDTLEYQMAKPSGQWLGTGFGDVKENKLWFLEGFRFPEKGIYRINIQQAMRNRDSISAIKELKGVTEVGFRIENSKN